MIEMHKERHKVDKMKSLIERFEEEKCNYERLERLLRESSDLSKKKTSKLIREKMTSSSKICNIFFENSKVIVLYCIEQNCQDFLSERLKNMVFKQNFYILGIVGLNEKLDTLRHKDNFYNELLESVISLQRKFIEQYQSPSKFLLQQQIKNLQNQISLLCKRFHSCGKNHPERSEIKEEINKLNLEQGNLMDKIVNNLKQFNKEISKEANKAHKEMVLSVLRSSHTSIKKKYKDIGLNCSDIENIQKAVESALKTQKKSLYQAKMTNLNFKGQHRKPIFTRNGEEKCYPDFIENRNFKPSSAYTHRFTTKHAGGIDSRKIIKKPSPEDYSINEIKYKENKATDNWVVELPSGKGVNQKIRVLFKSGNKSKNEIDHKNLFPDGATITEYYLDPENKLLQFSVKGLFKDPFSAGADPKNGKSIIVDLTGNINVETGINVFGSVRSLEGNLLLNLQDVNNKHEYSIHQRIEKGKELQGTLQTEMQFCIAELDNLRIKNGGNLILLGSVFPTKRRILDLELTLAEKFSLPIKNIRELIRKALYEYNKEPASIFLDIQEVFLETLPMSEVEKEQASVVLYCAERHSHLEPWATNQRENSLKARKDYYYKLCHDICRNHVGYFGTMIIKKPRTFAVRRMSSEQKSAARGEFEKQLRHIATKYFIKVEEEIERKND